MSSDTSESSEYSESEPEIVASPVFIRKKPEQKKDTAISKDNKSDRILQNLEQTQDSSKDDVQDQFDGVDDTDGLDPEQEYLQWKHREYKRYLRDRAELIEIEETQADLLRRNNMTEEELQREFDTRSSDKDQPALDENEKFRQKIAQRDYSQSRSDHSRPTRFK